ncbi:MAG: DUF3095 family protein [Spirochaetaceae bacterium]
MPPRAPFDPEPDPDPLCSRLCDVKRDNIINSDFRKFDGTLRMVLSGDRAQP